MRTGKRGMFGLWPTRALLLSLAALWSAGGSAQVLADLPSQADLQRLFADVDVNVTSLLHIIDEDEWLREGLPPRPTRLPNGTLSDPFLFQPCGESHSTLCTRNEEYCWVQVGPAREGMVAQCCPGGFDDCETILGCFDYKPPQFRNQLAPASLANDDMAWGSFLFCGSDRPYCVNRIDNYGFHEWRIATLTCTATKPRNILRTENVGISPPETSDDLTTPIPSASPDPTRPAYKNTDNTGELEEKNQKRTGIIIGSVIGGLAVVGTIIVIILWKRRQKLAMLAAGRNSRQELQNLPPSAPVAPADGEDILPQYMEPPPAYKCVDGCTCDACEASDSERGTSTTNLTHAVEERVARPAGGATGGLLPPMHTRTASQNMAADV